MTGGNENSRFVAPPPLPEEADAYRWRSPGSNHGSSDGLLFLVFWGVASGKVKFGPNDLGTKACFGAAEPPATLAAPRRTSSTSSSANNCSNTLALLGASENAVERTCARTGARHAKARRDES